jgi:hypothetical protein
MSVASVGTAFGCGMTVRNSASDVTNHFGVVGCYMARWNTGGAYFSDINTIVGPVGWAGYFEIESDGTNLIFRASLTGDNDSFHEVKSYGNTTNGLGAAPTHVGFQTWANGAVCRAVIHWWRRLA